MSITDLSEELQGFRAPLETSLFGELLRSGKSVLLANEDTRGLQDLVWADLPGLHTIALCVSNVHGRPYGALYALYSRRKVGHIEVELLELLAAHAGVAIGNALSSTAAQGKTFELAGPEVLTMLQLNQRIAAAQGRSRSFAELPDAVAGLIAALPGTPISGDQLKLLKAGSAASGTLPGLDDLGVTARPLGLFLDRWMVRFCKNGRFGGKTAHA